MTIPDSISGDERVTLGMILSEIKALEKAHAEHIKNQKDADDKAAGREEKRDAIIAANNREIALMKPEINGIKDTAKETLGKVVCNERRIDKIEPFVSSAQKTWGWIWKILIGLLVTAIIALLRGDIPIG